MNLAKLLVAIGATTSGFQRSMAAAERRVAALERRTGGLRRGFGRATGSMVSFTKKAIFLGSIVLVALTVALGGVVNAAINYEDAFAGVRKTVEATEPELQQLSADIREMSTVIPVAATELAGLAETAGALGVPTKNIKEFTRVTAMLGLTTNVSSAEAADALGRLSNILGLTADDYSKFASALVALGNAGASTESEILEIAKRMGAAGKIAGLTTPQIIGWASALASVTGMEPERAGTSMQMFLLSVTKISSKLGPKLTTLGKVSGMSAKQFKKLFNKDANKALLAFITGLDKLSKGKKLKVLEKLGFTESGITRALLGLASSHAEVARQLGISTEEYEKNVAAQAELDKRLATTKSQLALLHGILTDVAITIGDALLPVITPLIKSFGQWITANKELISQIAVDLVNGIQMVIGFVSDWITANGPLIAQVGGALVGALVTVWTVITTQVIPALFGKGGKGGIIPAIIELGSQIFNWLVPKVEAFITTLTRPGGVIESVLQVAGPVFKQLFDAFGTIFDALFTGDHALVPALGDFIGILWGNGKGPLADAVRNMGTMVTIFAGVFGTLAGKIADVVIAINHLIELKPKLADFINILKLLPMGGPSAALLQAAVDAGQANKPHRARGGPVIRGRPYLVNENTPNSELWVPGATGRVYPDVASMGAGAAGGDTHITIHNPEPRAADDDIGRVMRRLEGLGLVAARRRGSPA